MPLVGVEHILRKGSDMQEICPKTEWRHFIEFRDNVSSYQSGQCPQEIAEAAGAL